MKSPKLKPANEVKIRNGGKATLFDPTKYLETVAKDRSITAYKKKTVLFEQGEEADSVIYIRSGKVKVSILSAAGNEAVVAVLGADEFLGEGCLIGQTAAELFWTAKNGIRFTGMPAWGPSRSDQELWDVIAFVMILPTMSGADYDAMDRRIPPGLPPKR